MGFRQVIELTDPGSHPLSEDTARTDGNIALNRLIAAALTIRPRVPPGDNTHHLIRVGKQIDDQGQNGDDTEGKGNTLFQRKLGVNNRKFAAKKHHQYGKKYDDSRPGIRLQQD